MEFKSEEEYRNKKEEVISKFRKEFIKGHYNYNPQLHTVVELLTRGTDPYQIIEEVIKVNEDISKKMEEYIQNCQPGICICVSFHKKLKV